MRLSTNRLSERTLGSFVFGSIGRSFQFAQLGRRKIFHFCYTKASTNLRVGMARPACTGNTSVATPACGVTPSLSSSRTVPEIPWAVLPQQLLLLLLLRLSNGPDDTIPDSRPSSPLPLGPVQQAQGGRSSVDARRLAHPFFRRRSWCTYIHCRGRAVRERNKASKFANKRTLQQ